MTTQPYPWELDPPQIGDLVWCLHHNPRDGGAPIEILTEPIENRVDYIRKEKPRGEVEMRLHAMRKVRGPLPAALERARAARKQADAVCEQADAVRERARVAWERANAAWEQADAALERARAAWKRANAAWEQADAAWERTRAAWEQALDRHEELILQMFRAECPDVEWSADGLVFAGETS